MRDLVMLHGWGLTRRVWDPVIPALSRAFRVHNLDLPGYGERPPAVNPAEAGQAILDRWSDDVAGDAPPGAVWMGWSLGALVVLNAMRRAAGSIEAAVLVAATPRFIRDDGWGAGMAPEVLQELLDGIRVDAGKVLKRFLMLQAGGGESAREVSRAMAGSLPQRADPAVLETGLQVLRQVDLRSGLEGVGTRVLLVHGTGDRIAPPEAGRWLAEHLPRTELAALEAGHAPFFTRPREFTEAVLAWT